MIRKPSTWAKPATTVTTQVSILESRNMTVVDKNAAENFLRRVNYYRFCHYANSLVPVADDFTGITFEEVVPKNCTPQKVSTFEECNSFASSRTVQ